MSTGSLHPSIHGSRVALGWILGVILGSVILVAVDHLTGPFIRMTMGFAVAVAVAAYRWDWPAGIGLGVMFGISRLWLVLQSQVPWLVAPEAVNFLLNLLLFSAVAVAVPKLARRSRSLRSGTFPVCGGCGRVRDLDGRWMRFESFVTAVLQARFHHTVCPDCESRLARPGLGHAPPHPEHPVPPRT